MLNAIAHDLSYLGIILVVENVTEKRYWAATAILTSRPALYGSGATANAALEAVLASVFGENPHSPQETHGCLDSIAKDLLQLVVRRSESSSSPSSAWSATARLRWKWLFGRPRTITVTDAQPDEALEELIRQVKR